MKYNRKGFTLIELLVVISIIGLLSTLAVVSLNDARAKARDARRLSDIKQLQTALELYYNDNSAYPTTPASSAALGSATAAILSSTAGFCGDTVSCGTGAKYMSKVPADPSPNGMDYSYAQHSSGADYCISFKLESVIANIGASLNCKAEPSGITCAGNCM